MIAMASLVIVSCKKNTIRIKKAWVPITSETKLAFNALLLDILNLNNAKLQEIKIIIF